MTIKANLMNMIHSDLLKLAALELKESNCGCAVVLSSYVQSPFIAWGKDWGQALAAITELA